MMDLYATDGRCHNAEPGTYGHECGKPAVWIGTSPSGFRSGFCQRCRDTGYEARSFTDWTLINWPIPQERGPCAPALSAWTSQEQREGT